MWFQRRSTIVLAGFRPFLLSRAFPEGCYKFRKGEIAFHLSIRVLFCRVIYFSVCLEVPKADIPGERIAWFFGEILQIVHTAHRKHCVWSSVRGQLANSLMWSNFDYFFRDPRNHHLHPLLSSNKGQVMYLSVP